MGKHRLKEWMPRVYKDHRRAIPRRLRGVYDAIGARYSLTDEITRRVAILTALSALEHEQLTRDVSALSNGQGTRGARATQLGRLRRRQASYAGQFLAGLRTLEAMTRDGRSAAAQTDLAALLDPRRGA